MKSIISFFVDFVSVLLSSSCRSTVLKVLTKVPKGRY